MFYWVPKRLKERLGLVEAGSRHHRLHDLGVPSEMQIVPYQQESAPLLDIEYMVSEIIPVLDDVERGLLHNMESSNTNTFGSNSSDIGA